MLLLSTGDNPAGTVEHDETGARRALIDGSDVAGHAVIITQSY